jgi:hypothetical protein
MKEAAIQCAPRRDGTPTATGKRWENGELFISVTIGSEQLLAIDGIRPRT